jgi:hypothetical protein
VQPTELIAGEIEVGGAGAMVKVVWVGAGVDGAHRHLEAESVGAGHFTATPSLRQGNLRLRRDQPGIGQ